MGEVFLKSATFFSSTDSFGTYLTTIGYEIYVLFERK